MFPVQSVENIEVKKWADDQEVWTATIQQINKDLNMEFPDQSYSNTLHDVSSYLGQTNQLMEHLYRIDLPQQIFYACHINNALDTLLLAEWVIKREMYKVIFRKQYNG
jgi:nanoRNase/pAp phosphatase (c-di-AMP/oligoRNAs hydrolase)